MDNIQPKVFCLYLLFNQVCLTTHIPMCTQV